MAPKERRRLGNKYPSLFLTIIILLLCVKVNSQTYNPSLHTVTNKALGIAQATPTDARSMFYDQTNFIYRPYQSIVEVKTYLNLAKYRTGNFLIVVDSGGLLQPNGVYVGGHNNFWMFKDSTADANLIELNLQGSSGSCAGCLLAVNNLSDLANATTARSNLGLGSISTLSSTASGGDASGNWPAITVNSIQGKNLAYITNYLNLSNTPAIPSQLNPTGLGLVTITGVYPNLTWTGRTPGIEETIFANNATSRTDSLNIGAFLFRMYGTSAFGLPKGTTAQRPSSAAAGDTRWNTDSLKKETFDGASWVTDGSGGGGGGGITALTGDGTASGTGSVPFTLATVNSNVFGSNTFLKFGVNGKGLVTSATAVGSGDITGALGFTPYNATNPAGYISNITGLVTQGTEISITGSGTSGTPYVVNSKANIRTVKTIANLYALPTAGLTDSAVVVVTDTVAGGPMMWISTTTTVEDSGTIFKPTAISSGSPGRWIRQYNGLKSLHFWGVNGDNSTNVTRRTQLAMNSCVGGTLYVPSGIYLIDSLIYPAQLSMRGESRRNTRFQATASGAQSFIRLGPGQSNEIYWTDISIVANASNVGQKGFDFTAVPGSTTGGLWNFEMDRVDVTNFRGTGINLYCHDGAFDMAHQFLTFRQVRVYCTTDTASHAVVWDGQVNQTTFDDCEFDCPSWAAGTRGVVLISGGASNDQIVGGNTFHNISVQGFDQAVYTYNAQGVSFTQDYFESDSVGIYATNSSRITVYDIHLSNVGNTRYVFGNDNSVMDILGYRLTPNPITGKFYTSPGGTSGGGVIQRGVGQTTNTVTTVFTGQNINVSANTLNTGYFTDIITNVSSSVSSYVTTINSNLSPTEHLFIRAYDASHTSNNALLFKSGGNISLPGSLDSGMLVLHDGQSAEFARTDIGTSVWALVPSSITPLYMSAFPTTGLWITGNVVYNSNPTFGTAGIWVCKKGGIGAAALWDSLVVGAGGGSGGTNSNVGSGYRLAIPTTNNIKTIFGSTFISWDSTSNTNALTSKIANGTANNILGWDGSGNPASLAPDTLFVKNRVSGTGVQVGNISNDTLYLNNLNGSTFISQAKNSDSSITTAIANSTANTLLGWNGSGVPTNITAGSGITISGGVISSSGGSSALTNTHIFVGNASNIATDVALSGDATIANTGALTIASNAITTGKINNNAVTYGKLQAASGQSLLGATGAGNFQELTLGTNLSISGTTLNAAGSGTDTITQATAPLRITRASNVVTIGGDSLLNKYNSNYATTQRIQYYQPASGVNGTSDTVTNYGWANIDSALSYYTTVGKGADFGGWLVNSTSNDSVQLLTPIGVYIGNSFAAAHPWFTGPLEQPGGWNPTIADPWGTTTHTLDSLTHYKWYGMGIGGQTTSQMRSRFLRDVLGLPSNPNDGLGSRTIGRKASFAIIEGAINDLAAGVSDSIVRDNLVWMAETCLQYQVPCVMLNCPGDGSGTTKSYYQAIARLNKWMASGILQSLGVTVIDLNKLWNTAEMNNYNFSSYVNSGDKIHLTKTGYDTLGKIIFFNANIPVLTKAVIIKANSPTNPISGYNVPTGITFTGVSYSLTSNPIDTIAITSYITDSVWMKITSSSGAGSKTGVNSVLWYIDNDPTNAFMYTERTAFSGPHLPFSNMSSLNIRAKDYTVGLRLIDVMGNDNVYNHLRLIGGQSASTNMIINGGASPSVLNSSALTVYGHLSLNTGSNIFVPGFGSTIGNLQIGNTSNPSTLGRGVGYINSAMDFQAGQGSSMASEVMRFSPFSNTVYTITSSSTRFPMHKFNGGLGNGTDRDTVSLMGTNFQWNNTETGNVIPGFRGILDLHSTILSRGTSNRFYSIWAENGDNWLNTVTGKTSIGTINPAGSAKLDVTSRTRGFILPRMRQGQRDSIGYIGAVNITTAGTGYTTVPVQTITGTGTGAVINFMLSGGGIATPTIIDPGEGYKPGSSISIAFSGGGGSGAAATLTINGPDSGLMIYNTTVDSLQWYKPSCACWIDAGDGGQNIYNADGTLTGNRTLSGANFTLALGTSGSKLSNLSIWSTAGVNLTGGQYASTGGSQLLEVASTINNPVTAASGTVSNFSAYLFSAPTITSTNSSITYSSPATLRIDNQPTMSTNSTATGRLLALDVAAGITHMGVGSSNFSLIADGYAYFDGASPTNTIGVGFGLSTSSHATLNLPAGTDPSTGGVNTASGNMWYNGTNLYFVDGSTNGVKRDILNGIHNYLHSISTPATGGTVNLVANQYNIINPSGTIATLTVNLPSSPNNNDVVYIKYTQAVTTVTYGNGTVVDGITTPSAGGLVVLTFDSGTSSWY